MDVTNSQRIPHVTDERLCWLAVRDELGQKARKRGVFGWLSLLAAGGRNGRNGARMAGDMRREASSGKMQHYAFAVDEAATALGPDERKHLRSTGEVPGWFAADVERRVVEIRKRH